MNMQLWAPICGYGRYASHECNREQVTLLFSQQKSGDHQIYPTICVHGSDCAGVEVHSKIDDKLQW